MVLKIAKKQGSDAVAATIIVYSIAFSFVKVSNI
jgi:hypothetical protein